MATRYDKSKTLVTDTNNPSLKDVVENRMVDSISHYNTSKLRYPTSQEIQSFTVVKYTWKSNDRYWKVSNQFYGDPKYWWVIAWFNKKPIEAMIQLGEQISVPLPLSDVLGAMTR
jgi:nucleoid-associated protein YgaU